MTKKVIASSKKESSDSSVIVVAIIGLLGTVITAFFTLLASKQPVEIIIKATQTAEAKFTLVSSVTSSASIATPFYNRILFDTNHQEWGVEYGKGDINILKSLGYQIDLTEPPQTVSSLNAIYRFQIASNSSHVFEFETTHEYPVIGIWIEQGTDNADLTLEAETGQTFQTFLWSPFGFTNYTDIAYFENIPGKWKATLTPMSGGDYTIRLSAFEKAPLNPELLNKYSIVWFHNPIRQLLSQEQEYLLNYLALGGRVLYIDSDSLLSQSILAGAFPDSYYAEKGAEIRLYSSTFGFGRIAWISPNIANPVLYIDTPNQEIALDIPQIRQVMHWLETGDLVTP